MTLWQSHKASRMAVALSLLLLLVVSVGQAVRDSDAEMLEMRHLSNDPPAASENDDPEVKKNCGSIKDLEKEDPHKIVESLRQCSEALKTFVENSQKQNIESNRAAQTKAVETLKQVDFAVAKLKDDNRTGAAYEEDTKKALSAFLKDTSDLNAEIEKLSQHANETQTGDVEKKS
eukprot:TRINITY_DN51305_c0_g1_i1.p1 TRINITY_DN51305_c0_g1~~TRINITY_DN51305_c0_g1_i1.p1  ORF type:complete len:175 (-),score=53.48 TRINITY_DN51305_c0_g1_i1:41-565(-)